MKTAFVLLLFPSLFFAPQAHADETSTNCTIIGSSVSCDDGTDYRIFNDTIHGPDSEYYTLSKNPIGDDGKSIDGEYDTPDGTKIRVSGGMARVEYSDRVLRERKERARRRAEQKKEFDHALGKDNPVTVDADGFFE